MGRLSGKVAIVTGGAQGQGAAIVRGFVAEGASVVIADIATDEGELLAKELGDAVVFVRHDVTSEADWESTVATAQERFGKVDVLINNAGILLFSELTATSLEDYERVVRINQFGTFLGMRSVVAAMEAAGGGSIVNTSSIEGLGGMPFLVAYTSSKFAIRGMTKAAAMELGPKNIRVNSVHPGMIDTGMTRIHGGDAAMEWGGQRVALKRVGLPEDVVGMYLFLASDESSFCTGSEYVVDGGATATHAFGG
ncbi:MAG TPA: glucose 1-dehydrogenase [Candidatus Limnocylindrales bacterium]|nr:glucose 1-dehydrogenase [Candidatus Limnocylindrales bacterium]